MFLSISLLSTRSYALTEDELMAKELEWLQTQHQRVQGWNNAPNVPSLSNLETLWQQAEEERQRTPEENLPSSTSSTLSRFLRGAK
jgi:hypothetical protein